MRRKQGRSRGKRSNSVLIRMYIMWWVDFAEEYSQILNSAMEPNPIFLLILPRTESFCSAMKLSGLEPWALPAAYGWCSPWPSLLWQKAASLCYSTQTLLLQRHQDMFKIQQKKLECTNSVIPTCTVQRVYGRLISFVLTLVIRNILLLTSLQQQSLHWSHLQKLQRSDASRAQHPHWSVYSYSECNCVLYL